MRYIITSCTQKSQKEFETTPLGKSLLRYGLYDEQLIFYENTKGLSERYNEILDKYAGHKDTAIIFVHDDVYIFDSFIKDKIAEGFKTFDVLGVAGSSSFNLSNTPVCWSNSPKDNWTGGCFHPTKDKKDSILDVYYTDFGKFNRRCATLDGLILVVNAEKINTIRFDPDMKFDFYDLAFCLNCNVAGLKLGTIPISVAHMSHGAGILKQSYKDTQKLFVSKWKK